MNEELTLLEISPYYLNTLMIDLALEFAAFVIIVLLMVQYARRKHRTLELSFFFQMCLCNLFMTLAFAIFDIVPVVCPFDADTIIYHFVIWNILLWIILRIFSVTLFARWLVFVDYTLHQSRDLLRRRYKPPMAVYIAAIVMLFLSIPVALHVSHNAVSPLWIFAYYALSIVPYVIMIFFIVAAYVILYREKKYNRIPAYIRLTPTTLCVIAGFVADMLWGDIALLPLFFALGLLFANYFMYRRLRWIDPKTGFFNRKYLPELKRKKKKKQLTGATMIRFRVEQENEAVEMLIRSWSPTHSRVITMGDGLFLLVSEAVKDSVAERFISLLTEHANDLGITAEAGYETDPEAPVEMILTKYIPQKAV